MTLATCLQFHRKKRDMIVCDFLVLNLYNNLNLPVMAGTGSSSISCEVIEWLTTYLLVTSRYFGQATQRTTWVSTRWSLGVEVVLVGERVCQIW